MTLQEIKNKYDEKADELLAIYNGLDGYDKLEIIIDYLQENKDHRRRCAIFVDTRIPRIYSLEYVKLQKEVIHAEKIGYLERTHFCTLWLNLFGFAKCLAIYFGNFVYLLALFLTLQSGESLL